jgi:hypothetical protein
MGMLSKAAELWVNLFSFFLPGINNKNNFLKCNAKQKTIHSTYYPDKSGGRQRGRNGWKEGG